VTTAPYARAVTRRRGLTRALALTSILTVAAAALAPATADATVDATARPAAARQIAAAAPVVTVPGSITGVVRGEGGAALAGACVTASGQGAVVTGYAGLDDLRDDFARFRFLLGVTDGEGLFTWVAQ